MKWIVRSICVNNCLIHLWPQWKRPARTCSFILDLRHIKMKSPQCSNFQIIRIQRLKLSLKMKKMIPFPQNDNLGLSLLATPQVSSNHLRRWSGHLSWPGQDLSVDPDDWGVTYGELSFTPWMWYSYFLFYSFMSSWLLQAYIQNSFQPYRILELKSILTPDRSNPLSYPNYFQPNCTYLILV